MNLIINETIAEILFSDGIFTDNEVGAIIRDSYKYMTKGVADMSNGIIADTVTRLLCRDIDRQAEYVKKRSKRQEERRFG